ncbi:Pycsar system effector family protein [Bacillus sp. JJ783]|uniref:Pycsar system effector family protein n=1 Tax=Bacillus sp. JJ783 TaxID=3122974 RepID=UPI002FFF62BF
MGEEKELKIQQEQLKVEVHQTKRSSKTNFSYQMHTYLNNSIRFSDVKAAGISGVNVTIFRLFFDPSTIQMSWGFLTLGASLIGLLVGIVFAILSIMPRFMEKKENGLIYWGSVADMTREDYIEAIKGAEGDHLLEELLSQNYTLSLIAKKKFAMTKYAFLFSLVGYIFLIIGEVVKVL